MDRFKALRIYAHADSVQARLETISLEVLTPGEVVIRSHYSSINYKDALAATGKGKILRHSPLNGGIDVAGTIVSSSDNRFSIGEPVVITGCKLSETIDGGYSEYVRVPASIVVKLPQGLSLWETMGIGTAGFTAALAIQRMEDNGQMPADGPIIVTGATGGVGSLAIDMLDNLGYEVVAFTGKPQHQAYLENIGAKQVLLRDQITMGTRPLENAQWGGAIDNVGGDPLAWLTRTVKPRGNIASIGLASSAELHTTVMPFILRGINVLGINCDHTPFSLRQRIWQRLASDLHPRRLQTIVKQEVTLDELPTIFEHYINSQMVGRTIVRIGGC